MDYGGSIRTHYGPMLALCWPSPVVDNLLRLCSVVPRGRDTVVETDVAVTGGAPGCLRFSHGCVTARGQHFSAGATTGCSWAGATTDNFWTGASTDYF